MSAIATSWYPAGLDFSSFQAMEGGAGTPSAAEGSNREGSTREGNPGRIHEGRITHLGQQVAWLCQEVPEPVIAA